VIKIKKSNVYVAMLVILLTYVNNPFYFVGVTSLHKLAYYALALIPVILSLIKGIITSKNINYFFRYFIFYFFYVFFVSLITFSFDFKYIIYFGRLLIGIFGVISIYFINVRINNKHAYKIKFENIYVKSTAFYIWGTTIFIIFPPIKNLWSSLLADLGKTDFSNVVEYITRFGFCGFSGFSCAFMVCAACIYLIYLYLNKGITENKFRYYSLLFIIGSFFYGRIGMVVSVVLLELTALYSCFHKKSKLLFFYNFLLFLIISIFYIIYCSFQNSNIFIKWLFEPVFNFFEHGKLESASTDGLKKFYESFHPTNKTLFIGDGFWIDGDAYYGHTDVGFMRNIYYGGIFYTFFLYLIPLSLSFFIYWQMKKMDKKGSGFLCMLLLILFVLFELKGDITFVFIKAFLPMLYLLVMEQKQDSQIRNFTRRFKI
jgi:hypothetical protein